jgi:hypothetical protein
MFQKLLLPLLNLVRMHLIMLRANILQKIKRLWRNTLIKNKNGTGDIK